MPENSNPPTVLAITDRYRQAVKNLKMARLTVGLLVFCIVLCYAMLLWVTYKDFRDKQLPLLTAELSAEAAAYMPEVADRLSAMLNKVLPIYANTIAEKFNKDQEKYLVVLTDEFSELERYGQKKWPELQEAIAQLALDQEKAVNKALVDIVPPQQLEAVGVAYCGALQKRMEEMFSEHFEKQIMVGEQIINNLIKLAETEPDLPKQDSTNYIFGLLLELLGLQMQYAEGYDYSY